MHKFKNNNSQRSVAHSNLKKKIIYIDSSWTAGIKLFALFRGGKCRSPIVLRQTKDHWL